MAVKTSLKTVSAENTVTDSVVEAILEYIAEHKLVAGDPVPGTEFFCEKLGVSRVICREAMSQLKGMRLVNSCRGKGFTMASMDAANLYDMVLPVYLNDQKGLREISMARAMFEIGTFPLILKNCAPVRLKKLTEAVQEMEELLRQERILSSDYVSLDGCFHLELAKAGKNRLLEVLDRHYFSRWQELSKGEVVCSGSSGWTQLVIATEQHRKIVEAIKLKAYDLGMMRIFEHYKTFLYYRED